MIVISKNISPYDNSTDVEIWNDFLAGDKEAYAFIYEKYVSILYNYGYKIAHDQQLTEDCVQDLFLNILEKRENLSSTDSIRFYLLSSLRREIVRRLKNLQKFSHDLESEKEIEFKVNFYYQPTWLESKISQEQADQLLDILNQLPSRQKEAVFLRFYENMSYEEIAKVMDIEQTSAYKVIYKALASMHKKLPFAIWILLATDFIN